MDRLSALVVGLVEGFGRDDAALRLGLSISVGEFRGNSLAPRDVGAA